MPFVGSKILSLLAVLGTQSTPNIFIQAKYGNVVIDLHWLVSRDRLIVFSELQSLGFNAVDH